MSFSLDKRIELELREIAGNHVREVMNVKPRISTNSVIFSISTISRCVVTAKQRILSGPLFLLVSSCVWNAVVAIVPWACILVSSVQVIFRV